MAIVISKNSALNDDLWKPVAQVVNAVLEDTDAEKTKYDQLVADLAIEKKSNKYAEKQTGITSLSSFDVVNEGDKAKLDDLQEAFPKLIVHSAFSKSVALTKEMLDDGDIDTMKVVASNLVKAYKRTRAELMSKALTCASSSFTYGGHTFDCTTGDGQALFSTAHVNKKDGATQSNKSTKQLTLDNLIALANMGRNFTNESGIVTGYEFDTIIVPGNCPTVENAARVIINSDKVVGSNNNDVNTQKGKWTLIVDPLWTVAANETPYILMSSEANKAYNGTVFYDRTALDVKSEVEIDSRNLKYNGYGRMSCGFNNWRHLIYSTGAEA